MIRLLCKNCSHLIAKVEISEAGHIIPLGLPMGVPDSVKGPRHGLSFLITLTLGVEAERAVLPARRTRFQTGKLAVVPERAV